MTNPDEDQIERDAKVMYDFIMREGVEFAHVSEGEEFLTYRETMDLLKRAIRKVHQENYPARVRVKAGKETK
jgi:hypothetical protein